MFDAFDIHSHVNFVAFNEDRDEVIARAHKDGIGIINVGTQKNTSESAIALAEKYNSGMYATVGIHPMFAATDVFHDKKELTDEEFSEENFTWDYNMYKKLGSHEKVVAIGECGLDYFRTDEDSKARQVKIFEFQIDLANELSKPLMFHVRGERGDDTAYEDALEILKKRSKVSGNFHFFAGSLNIAKRIWGAGYTTSFTGVITFTKDYDETIKEAPIEKIMAETDAPYVAPALHRGKRNEPAYVFEVIKKIAEIRGEDLESVKNELLKNSQKFFNI